MTTFETNDRDFEGELAHQLAIADVPPVPDELDEALHSRLNNALQTHHWITFFTAVIPMVIVSMLTPIGYFMIHTISGRLRRSPGTNEDS